MSVMEETSARTRRSFTDEFKRDAVAMVLDDGHKVVDVAGRLGIGEGTLGNWPDSTGRGNASRMEVLEMGAMKERQREVLLYRGRSRLRDGRRWRGERTGCGSGRRLLVG